MLFWPTSQKLKVLGLTIVLVIPDGSREPEAMRAISSPLKVCRPAKSSWIEMVLNIKTGGLMSWEKLENAVKTRHETRISGPKRRTARKKEQSARLNWFPRPRLTRETLITIGLTKNSLNMPLQSAWR